MRVSRSSAAALALSLPLATAQTFTTCDPLNTTCPNNPGLKASTFSTNFLQGKSALSQWTADAGTTLTFGDNGAEFTIQQAGQAPTIQTDFYIFFGRIDVTMRAAPGAGIVSSIVLLSDDLDEIDWEFLGGNTAQVETNFFGKGNTTLYNRATYQSVTTPQTESHTYTVDWNSDRIEWIIDGQTVRTVTYDNALTVFGKNYPQTPMRLKLGNWCGGCSGESEGTVQWAGGPTTFNDAPYNMYVESVQIQNTNPASAYQWVGNSGSWQSIKLVNGGAVSGGSTTGGSGSGASSTMHNTSNYTRTKTATGGLKTATSFTTDSAPTGVSATAASTQAGASSTAGASSAAGASSSSSNPSMASSATSLAMLTSTTLFGLLCGFMLL